MFKKIYFYIFYNTNFILNGNIILGIFIPLFFLNIIYGKFENFFIGIFSIVISTFIYNIIYIINDYFDIEKDKAKNIYKFSVLTEYNVNILLYGILFYIVLFLLLFLFKEIFIDINYIVFSFIVLFTTIIAIIHSKYKKLKLLTIFIERSIKIIFPVFIFYSLSKEYFVQVFLCYILIFLPFFIDKGYKHYIAKKLDKNLISKRFFIYAGYYFFLLILIYSKQYSMDFLLFLYLTFSFFFLNILHSIRGIKFNFLSKIYSKDLQEKNEIVFSMIINLLFIVLIFLYEIIFRFGWNFS